MINLVKQKDGNYAVNADGKFLGFVGRDDNGWWSTCEEQQFSGRGMSASYFYVSGKRTQKAALADLLAWHRVADPLHQITKGAK